MQERLKALIDKVHGYEVRLEEMEFTVHFRDREREIEMLFTDVLGSRGISLIYGPRGAGKSTLAEVIVRGANELGEINRNYAFVHLHLDEGIIKELKIQIPNLSDDVINQLKNVFNLDINLGPIGFSIKLGNAIYVLAEVVKRYGLDDRMIVVFLDDVDKYVKRLGYDVLEAVANAIPDIIRREGVKMQVVFMVSDQAAADVVNKVGPKGGLTPYLLWNLPRRAFEEVINEISEKTGVEYVDTDLLWNLLGGNVRELEKLVSRYRWDVKTWLQDEVINFIRDVLKANIDLRTFKDVNEVLEAIIEKGRVAARDYGLGEFTGQPDAIEGAAKFLENNVMIKTRMRGIKYLSELPREPWVGSDFAYQIPAYYWVLRAMIEQGRVGVSVNDILRTINTSANASRGNSL